jgi:hypothetical protein
MTTTLQPKHTGGAVMSPHADRSLVDLMREFREDAVDFYPNRCRSKREPHDVLTNWVVAEELRTIEPDPRRLAAKIRKSGFPINSRQISQYFAGMYRPHRSIVNHVAQEFDRPTLRELYEWPWELLNDDLKNLTIPKIEEICAPAHDVLFKLAADDIQKPERRRQSRWHTPISFDPRILSLEPSGNSSDFWRSLAHFRAAQALEDHESVNAHLMSVIRVIPAILSYPSVRPFAEYLFSCIHKLTLRKWPFVWFTIDWDIVRRAIEPDALAKERPLEVFKNVFRGRQPDLGFVLCFEDLDLLLKENSLNSSSTDIAHELAIHAEGVVEQVGKESYEYGAKILRS